MSDPLNPYPGTLRQISSEGETPPLKLSDSGYFEDPLQKRLLDEHYDRQVAYIDKLLNGWIKVNEADPPDGVALVCGPAYNDPESKEYWYRVAHYIEGRLYEDELHGPWEGHRPTHWRPLPKPPKE